jgi:hypothetical protein
MRNISIIHYFECEFVKLVLFSAVFHARLQIMGIHYYGLIPSVYSNAIFGPG